MPVGGRGHHDLSFWRVNRRRKAMIVRCSPLFQAHISASLILNGVAVRWVGHIDLERLEGTGRIEFDHQLAKVSELDQIQGKKIFPMQGLMLTLLCIFRPRTNCYNSKCNFTPSA